MTVTDCGGHAQGFEHLDVQALGELRARFHLAEWTNPEPEEGLGSETDPDTGITAWDEPWLARRVSFTHFGSGQSGVLTYGLSRYQWESPVAPCEEDFRLLRERSDRSLLRHLRLLDEGGEPVALIRPDYV